MVRCQSEWGILPAPGLLRGELLQVIIDFKRDFLGGSTVSIPRRHDPVVYYQLLWVQKQKGSEGGECDV